MCFRHGILISHQYTQRNLSFTMIIDICIADGILNTICSNMMCYTILFKIDFHLINSMLTSKHGGRYFNMMASIFNNHAISVPHLHIRKTRVSIRYHSSIRIHIPMVFIKSQSRFFVTEIHRLVQWLSQQLNKNCRALHKFAIFIPPLRIHFAQRQWLVR